MTKKYYDEDAYRTECEAIVLSCEPHKNGFSVLLDGTVFFPEEGGQKADTGNLNGIPVTDVQIRGTDIFHITPAPFVVGQAVHAAINFPLRYHKMQNHSGEHVVSGIIHTLYGLDNVGFHLGSEDVTLDFSGELTREDLNRVEELANDAIYQNIPIYASYPSPDVLDQMTYRSKLDLKENVRIVSIGTIDTCACCAPHVKSTGEIGMIKLLDFIRYKGGIRIHMQCGKAALMDYREKYHAAARCSALMSVKQHEIAQGVSALLKQNEDLSLALRATKRRLAEELAQAIVLTDPFTCLFKTEFDTDFWREVAMLVTQKQNGALFFLLPKDKDCYSYVACSQSVNLKKIAPLVNRSLGGKGGGKEGMIQGTFFASQEEIRHFFSHFTAND